MPRYTPKAAQGVASAPLKLPRESVEAKPRGESPAEHQSPLGVYLKVNKISQSAFGRALGVDMKSVSGWAKGETLPNLPSAFEIERCTKGVVPMESWLALPQARRMLAEMHGKQEVSVRQLKQEVGGTGGGFAGQQEGET